MIDGETGEQIEEEDDQVTTFLKYLHEEGETILLRKFAVWCAREVNQKLKPIQKKILDLAEEAIQQDTDKESLRELYEETEGAAIATDTVGLRQGNENAPAYLAARECINPDPLEGAIQAARFHRLWAEMKEENKDEDKVEHKALKKIKAKTSESTIQKVEQQQTDYLLDLMNK
jgi:FlaA1/EpsC-like NDP-sugar epimerase